MSAKRAAEDDNDGEGIDLHKVFIPGRIRSQVMDDERVGRLTNKAAERIGKLRVFVRCQ